VTVFRLFIRKARVRQPEQGPAAVRREFDLHHRLGPFRCGGKPRQFDKPIAFVTTGKRFFASM